MAPRATEVRSDAMTGEGALTHLTERARALMKSRALQQREKTNVQRARALLSEKPENVSRKQRAYRKFLLEVRNRTNGSALFICMATMGQKRVIEMTRAERHALVEKLRAATLHEPFNSENLRDIEKKARIQLEAQAGTPVRCKCLV